MNLNYFRGNRTLLGLFRGVPELKTYRIDFKLCATAYIRAASPEEAQREAEGVYDEGVKT